MLRNLRHFTSGDQQLTLTGQAFQQPPSHEQKNDRERQARADCSRLNSTQGIGAATKDQCGRYGTLHYYPEHTLGCWRIGFTTGGDAVHNQRAGVRGRYKEHSTKTIPTNERMPVNGRFANIWNIARETSVIPSSARAPTPWSICSSAA